jgi:hypothetical protein
LAAPLINGHGGWNASDFFRLGSVEDWQVLARKSGEAVKIATLALGKKYIKGKSRLAGTRNPGDHHQLVARYL